MLRHLVEPVRFRELTQRLHETGIRAFVQAGPGSLTGFAEDTLRDLDFLTVAATVPQRDGLAQLRRVAAALWAHGLPVRIDRLETAATGTAITGTAITGTGVTGTAVTAPPPQACGCGWASRRSGSRTACSPTPRWPARRWRSARPRPCWPSSAR